jgi:hypothetical protein
MDDDEPGAVDFEAECALLELACTQPDVKEEESSDELQEDEWEELALLAAEQADGEGSEQLEAAGAGAGAADIKQEEPPWSDDEDRRLTALMLERRPTDSWTIIAIALGGDRSVTSCSRRWSVIAGLHGDSIREGARRAAREFLEEADAQQPGVDGAAQDAASAVNLRILSTASVSVVPFEVPPDEFALLVANLPRGIDEDSLQRMFSPFGALYEIQVRSEVGTAGSEKNHCFVRFFSSHDARSACDALHGKFVRGHRISIRVGVKRERSVGRAFSPLAPEQAVVLLQYYLPLSFSSSIQELELAAEDRLIDTEAVAGTVAAAAAAPTADSDGGAWHCRYAATVSLQLHQRRGTERDMALGSSEGEHTDSSRGTARAVAMKRAKRLALQAAFSELVLVIDHVEGAALVLFDDEL